ncbi:MAG: hypothetical protein OXC79_09980, partial [Candidatus Poribacteria bacterium]|nr:hypothetical protein [Candidatus Poribacteria bacterium]
AVKTFKSVTYRVREIKQKSKFNDSDTLNQVCKVLDVLLLQRRPCSIGSTEGIIGDFTLCSPKSFDEPIQPGYMSYEYNFSEINIHQIYFPISPQLALHGVNTEYPYNEPNLLPHNIFLMLSKNETLELNSWVLSYIFDHSKTKAVGSNYGILEQSAIYYNSKNTAGPRYIS